MKLANFITFFALFVFVKRIETVEVASIISDHTASWLRENDKLVQKLEIVSVQNPQRIVYDQAVVSSIYRENTKLILVFWKSPDENSADAVDAQWLPLGNLIVTRHDNDEITVHDRAIVEEVEYNVKLKNNNDAVWFIELVESQGGIIDDGVFRVL